MTPISSVFMLPIDSKLDYATLARVVRSGHSRVPVYEEIEEPSGVLSKKIIGILLVKQCVLLDPEGERQVF
jgi:metal transporter CNNM